MSVGNSKFEELVRVELLESGCVSDVALITKAGVCLHAVGEQFHEASLDGCVAPNWAEIASLLSSSVNVTVDLTVDKEVTTFRVFYRSSCSVYAICDGGLYTLLVCDLPVGILVCLSASPATVNQAAPLVERVADKLRA